jgi:hypothetical protein
MYKHNGTKIIIFSPGTFARTSIYLPHVWTETQEKWKEFEDCIKMCNILRIPDIKFILLASSHNKI